MIRIKGIPITNLRCLVLCLKIHKPSKSPMLPPKIASVNKVDSDIRQTPLRAFCLSKPITQNARMLMANK